MDVSTNNNNDLCFGSPADAGFDPERLERAFQVVQDAVGDGEGLIPAVAAVVRNGVVIGPRAWGGGFRVPERIAATPNTIFDMASLTRIYSNDPVYHDPG